VETTKQSGTSRPWLTEACDLALRRFASRLPRQDSAPLGQIPRHLLVVKVHGMGDSVLIRSILEKLRARNSAMRIGILAGPGTVDILSQGADFIVHLYHPKELTFRSAVATLLEIRRSQYDAVLNLEQGSVAGTAFLAATGIPVRLGFLDAAKSAKHRFLTHVACFDDRRSMWQSFLALARLIDPGISEVFGPFSVTLSEETQKWLFDWWKVRIRDAATPVAFHLGSAAGMDFRRWPLKQFVSLAEHLQVSWRDPTIILTGTHTESGLIQGFMSEYAGASVDASDAGTIQRTIAILQRCALLVSNDTGIMHLGAALGVPTVGLFGPNTPRHWAPLGARATYVYDTRLACSPCINNYSNQVPTVCTNAVKSRCMHDITVPSVLNAVHRVAANGRLY
jgi:ADP-heptose:LPS heptosyltransferase